MTLTPSAVIKPSFKYAGVEIKEDKRNRCRRCSYPLKDVNALYGWFCAMILGVNTDGTSKIKAANLRKFGRERAEAHAKQSPGKTETDMKLLAEAYVKFYLALEIDNIDYLAQAEAEIDHIENGTYDDYLKSGSKRYSLKDYIKAYDKKADVKTFDLSDEEIERLFEKSESMDKNNDKKKDKIITNNDNKIMKASDKGCEFIKNYESFRSKIYDANPPNKDWTIGYGHKLYEGTQEFERYVKNGISESEAEKLFTDDMEKMLNVTFLPFLKENNIKLTQNQFDAMASFTYNFGEYTWGKNGYETIKKFLINGDFSESATREAFKMYMGSKASDGHIARRNDEIEMFLYGDYEREDDITRP